MVNRIPKHLTWRIVNPDTYPSVHETVLEMLKVERQGKLLDAGAGEGALTQKLVKMAFEVEACDLNPARFKLKNIMCRKVDLHKKLPYDNESFDIVLCIEVIEHLHDPWHIISEFGRILKKNGKLIVTTPNILALQSRLHFLLFGEQLFFEHGLLWKEPKNLYEKLDVHITPISFPQLSHILTKNSMKLEAVAINRKYPKQLTLTYHGILSYRSRRYLISCLLHPLIKWRMKRYFSQFENSTLTSDKLLNDLLSGEILIVKARKL